MKRFRSLFGALFATFSILANAVAIDSSMQATVVEFYNASLDHYFITTDQAEIDALTAGTALTGWKKTDLTFQAIKAGSTVPGSTAVCRFYGRPEAKLDSHFFTGTLAECEAVKKAFPDQWQLESNEVFRAIPVDDTTGNCPADTAPIYRLWNNRADVNHRYTDQIAVADQMVKKGFIAEGNGSPSRPVIFCMPIKAGAAPASTTGAPNCALYSSDSAPLAGSKVTLSAACSDVPTSFTWTGCSSTGSTCTATAPVPGVASYTIKGTNAKGTGPAAKLDVNWASSGGAVPICTLGTSVTSPTINSYVTLTSTCSQSPSRYEWNVCSYNSQTVCNPISTCGPTASSCSVLGPTAGYVHYAVRASNSAGAGSAAGIDVNWTAPTGGGGGGGPGPSGQPSCTITADTTSPPVGTAVTLTATCTNNPSSYGWTGCSGLGTTCTATAAAPGKKTYQLVASNTLGNGAPAYFDVTWITSGPPSCTLAASDTNPVTGTSITLTATCQGATGAYVWTGCTSTVSSCVATSANVGAQQYSVQTSNTQGTSVPATRDVTWKAPPPPPTVPPTCSIAADLPNPYVGQPVTLTATCDQQTTSYLWTGCAVGNNPAKCTATAAGTGTASYTVVGSNVVGPSALASLSLTWQASTAGIDYCPAAAQGGSQVIHASGPTWGFAGYTLPGDYGGAFTTNMIIVVPITIPGSPSAYASSVFQANAMEYMYTPQMRWMSLSKSPCDFRAEDRTGVSGPVAFAGDTQGYLQTQGVAGRVGANEVMKPGETWYINIWAHSGKYPTCKKGANCTFAVGYFWPR